MMTRPPISTLFPYTALFRSNLGTQNNVIGTASATNQVNTVSLRDDGGFDAGTIDAATSITLSSNGAVTQSGGLTTPTLTLTANTGGSGGFTPNKQNNADGTGGTTGDG